MSGSNPTIRPKTNPILTKKFQDLDKLTALLVDISKKIGKRDTMIEELKKKKIEGHTNPHGSKSINEEKLDKLATTLENYSVLNDQFIEEEMRHINLGEKLPKGVDLKDLPKFKGTGNPLNHVRNFKTVLMMKGIDSKLFACIFPLTLEGGAGPGYGTFPSIKALDWETLQEEFCA